MKDDHADKQQFFIKMHIIYLYPLFITSLEKKITDVHFLFVSMKNAIIQWFDDPQVVDQQRSWLVQSDGTIVDLSTGMDTDFHLKKVVRCL